MPDTLLITGTTGFVGRALVRNLLAGGRGGTLRCLVRRPGSLGDLGVSDSACVVGSLDDRSALLRAAEGATACVHLAGTIKALTAAEYLRVNAAGTENLVAALEQNAPGCRLVHVSSLAAAGPSVDGSGSSAAPEGCRPPSSYGESKRQGELRVVASTKLRWIILRPPIIYGPADSASGFLVRQALAPLCAVPSPPRPLSLIHVDDVVRAIWLATESTRHAVILPLDGPVRLDTDSLMRTIGAACGRRTRLVHTPLWVARLAALPAEAYARVVRRPGIFSLDKLREVGAAGWIADPEPARSALGFVAECLPEAGFAGVAAAMGLLATRGS